MDDKTYAEVMEEAYKAPDYLSPHDIDSRLDDEGYPMDDGEPHNYVEIVSDNIFIGDYPLEEILNGLTEQFTDYINLEDTTNYVDIFYVQWEKSIAALEEDNGEYHVQDLKEALDNIKDKFLDKINELFERRLTITILAVDDESTPDIDELEIVIRQLYEFFILNAKSNFISVIAGDIAIKLVGVMDDNEFNARVKELLNDYSPLIRSMDSRKFLQYCENQDIIDLYDSGQIAGNFLRKYSPKLYQNEELQVEIINEVCMIQSLKHDIETTISNSSGTNQEEDML